MTERVKTEAERRLHDSIEALNAAAAYMTASRR